MQVYIDIFSPSQPFQKGKEGVSRVREIVGLMKEWRFSQRPAIRSGFFAGIMIKGDVWKGFSQALKFATGY